MKDRLFIDTNIWIYMFDRSEPIKQHLATKYIEKARQLFDLVVSTQVLQEVYVNLLKGKAAISSKREAKEIVESLANYTLIQIDKAMILSAVRLHHDTSLSFWDTLIITAAQGANCKRIITEDMQHGQRFGNVQIENPLQ